jgi:hypothetical protein
MKNRDVDFSRCAQNDAEVLAFHPGCATFPIAPAKTPVERLAEAERSLLELAIERHLFGSGTMRDLAVSIVALRAEVRG